MNKAVFLDRDGVINDNSREYYIYTTETFLINPDVIISLETLRDNGYKLFVVSNQGGISKGQYSKEDVDLVHAKLENILGAKNLFVEEIYFCPHHDSIENCLCRKPDSLLIEKLIARFNISIENSFFIGDSERDIIAAEKAGLKAIKIDPNTSILEICKSISKTK